MGVPFVYLFTTPNSQYAYDVGKNDLIRLSEELYSYLESLLNGGTAYLNKHLSEQMSELVEMGYLSDKHPTKIEHPLTSVVPVLLDRRLEKMTLQLTQQCNFRCKYCVYSEDKNLKQRAHSNTMMSFDLAKQAIDFFARHSVDVTNRNVAFYGGEPMLEFDLLKRIVMYAEDRLEGKRLTFNMTTNGSLLNEENAQFLQDHNVAVTLSLDGPKSIQDKYRVYPDGSGTFDIVYQKLLMIAEKFPALYSNMNINMVINPDNDYTEIDNFVHTIPGYQFNKVMANMVEDMDKDEEPAIAFVEEYQYQLFRSFLSEINASKKMYSPLCYATAHEATIGQKGFTTYSGMPDVTIPSGTCIPGKNRLFVTVEGKLYSCERVYENDEMCIGSIIDGIDVDRVKHQINTCSAIEDECCQCWAIHLCTFCPKTSSACGDLHGERRRRICDNIRKNAIFKLKSIMLLKEIRNEYRGICLGGAS